ncbi:predicted protein [Lichtheimia corymbifera JMRC:FSU:9682]|uniref:Uncharacterized protein n=1 Tax=Lichtheimia corymbifera JMRC:FSU:9682 TaxID=1263082 RepID=A0A068RKM6_9FUNG|nr:predicted protein [Lichtheimia corymbifera JMRC:FSU:9682]
MRTILISMPESTSRPSFDVPTSNIDAHGAYTLGMFPSILRLSYIQCFHNELWGLYETEIARRGRKGVV